MKKIIVLDRNTSESQVTYNCLFWFVITANPRTQGNGSQWVPNGASLGASATENQGIQAGSILEEAHSFSFPVNTPTADIQNVVSQAWTNRNSQVGGMGPNQFYGTFLDSVTGWGVN